MSADEVYSEAVAGFGAAIERLARAYEADPDKRRDLLQEIHMELWRSFAVFDGRCSLRTWVYRVAHNVATAHVVRQRRLRLRLVGIEDVESLPDYAAEQPAADRLQALERLSLLVQRLKPLDRQVIVLYLEGMDAAATGEITGLAPGNVAMKIHRIKNILRRWFHEGVPQ